MVLTFSLFFSERSQEPLTRADHCVVAGSVLAQGSGAGGADAGAALQPLPTGDRT